VKEKKMANKKHWLGMAVLALLFGLVLVGCDLNLNPDSGGYTFEFKVRNAVGISAIAKIEFINGTNDDAPILATEEVNLTEGEMSNVYRVSGFTEKDGDGKRIFGVKVTTPGGNTHFDYSSAKDGGKIAVSVSAPFWVMLFSDGNW
jgi:hypothetical protein